MANQVLAQMTLPEYTLGQSQFKPIIYEGVKDDNKLLAQSLAQLEGRMNKAQETKTQIDTELSKIESQIHDDPDTKSWFASVKQETQDKIQGLIDSGNFGEAIRTATDLGGTILKRSDVLGKIKNQQQWNDAIEVEKKRLSNGDINRDDFDYWIDHGGKYESKNIYDSDNKTIIGTYDSIYRSPMKSIQYSNLAKLAMSLASPQGGSSKSSGGSDNTKSDGSATGGRWSSGSSTRKVTEKSINENLEALINEAGGEEAIIQDFKSKQYALKQKEDRLKVLQEEGKINTEEYIELLGDINLRKRILVNANGATITDPYTYFKKQVATYAKNLSYSITDTESSNFTSTIETPEQQQGTVTLNGVKYNTYGGQIINKVEDTGNQDTDNPSAYILKSNTSDAAYTPLQGNDLGTLLGL